MKKVLKLISITLVMLLVVIAAAGCGTQTNTGNTGSTNPSSSVQCNTDAQSSGTQENADLQKQAMPARVTMITNTAYPVGSSDPVKYKAFIDAVKAETGVLLDVINSTNGEVIAQTKLAAGESFDLWTGGFQNLYMQDALTPIKQEWIDSSQNLKQIDKNSWLNFTQDGKIIAIPFRSPTKTAYFIRQDWLDKLKLNIPVTIDDFYNVTKAFAKNDPDGNGKNDTYGYSASNQWDSIVYFFNPIQAAFCKYLGSNAAVTFDVDEQKLKYNPFEKDYEDYLAFLAKSYSEKIIDQVIFTNNHENMLNNFYSGKTGVLLYFAGTTDDIIAKTQAVNANARISIMGPPSGPQGKGYLGVMGSACYSIVRTCKDPVGVTKFVDWILGNKGQQLLVYGPENIDWKMQNGTAVLTGETAPNFGMTADIVLLSDQFVPILPMSENYKKALEVFKDNKFDNSSFAPVNPNEADMITLFQEYYAKIVCGKLTVQQGLEEWKAKFNEKGFNKYFDDANKDLSWAPTTK